MTVLRRNHCRFSGDNSEMRAGGLMQEWVEPAELAEEKTSQININLTGTDSLKTGR
jgi:hypothetical protein